MTVPANANTKFAPEPDSACVVVCRTISPVVSALIATNFVTSYAPVIVTWPVCSVTTPAKARSKSSAEPDSACVVVSRTIAPVVSALIATNFATSYAPVIVTWASCSVTTPAKARSKSSAEPDSACVVVSRTIAPVVSALIATNFATSYAPVIVTWPVCSVTSSAKARSKSSAEPDNATPVLAKVIAPVDCALISFNCATV